MIDAYEASMQYELNMSRARCKKKMPIYTLPANALAAGSRFPISFLTTRCPQGPDKTPKESRRR